MKKVLSMIISLVLVFMVSGTALAGTQRCFDHAGLLSQEERTSLESVLERESEECSANLLVYTTYGTNGKSMTAFADDFYDQKYGGADGAVLVIDMEDRAWYISSAGEYDDALSERALDYIEDSMLDSLKDGDYYGAFCEYAAATAKVFEGHVSNVDPAFSYGGIDWQTSLIVALVVGLLAGFAVAMFNKGKLKTVHRRIDADDYEMPGTFHVDTRHDIFLYQTVTRTAKPKDDDDGFGSGSTHMSDGGFSHGGGGGHF